MMTQTALTKRRRKQSGPLMNSSSVTGSVGQGITELWSFKEMRLSVVLRAKMSILAKTSSSGR